MVRRKVFNMTNQIPSATARQCHNNEKPISHPHSGIVIGTTIDENLLRHAVAVCRAVRVPLNRIHFVFRCFYKTLKSLMEWLSELSIVWEPRCVILSHENRFVMFIAIVVVVVIGVLCLFFFLLPKHTVAKVHVPLHRLKNGWKHKVPCKLPNFEQINTSTEKWMARWHCRRSQWFRLMRFFCCMYTKYYDFDVVYTNASTRNSCAATVFFFLFRSYFFLRLLPMMVHCSMLNEWIWFIGLSSVRV